MCIYLQLIILIDVFAGNSANSSIGGCAALGGLLQFTALFQFLWILALVGITIVCSITVHYQCQQDDNLSYCWHSCVYVPDPSSHSWSGNQTTQHNEMMEFHPPPPPPPPPPLTPLPPPLPLPTPILQAIALWVNFMGFTDGREPLIVYILVTCGERNVRLLPVADLHLAGLECHA